MAAACLAATRQRHRPPSWSGSPAPALRAPRAGEWGGDVEGKGIGKGGHETHLGVNDVEVSKPGRGHSHRQLCAVCQSRPISRVEPGLNEAQAVGWKAALHA